MADRLAGKTEIGKSAKFNIEVKVKSVVKEVIKMAVVTEAIEVTEVYFNTEVKVKYEVSSVKISDSKGRRDRSVDTDMNVWTPEVSKSMELFT